MKITIGGLTKAKALKALKDNDMRISGWATDILAKVEFAKKKKELELHITTVGELFGDTDSHTFKEICEKGIELGYELCPAEVGVQLRLQYKDQPAGEWLIVAMKAIKNSDGALYGFYVGHDGDGRWLHALSGNPDFVWISGLRFVFVRRKSSELSPSDSVTLNFEPLILTDQHGVTWKLERVK